MAPDQRASLSKRFVESQKKAKSTDTVKRPIKRRKLDLSEEFKVVVGEGEAQQTFTVPKAFLLKSSEFFKPACSRDWREGQAKTIELKEQTANAFSIYVQWLYTGELVVCDDPPDSSAEADFKKEADKTYTALVELYLFAEFVMDKALRNDVVDEVIRVCREVKWLPSWELHDLFVSGQQDSTLHRLVVDIWATSLTDSDFYIAAQDDMPSAFRGRLLCKLNQIRLNPKLDAKPHQLPRCTYHEHDDGLPKCDPTMKASPLWADLL